MPEKLFGIIGKSLKHSFSPAYFLEKFTKENIKDCAYKVFELEEAEAIKKLFENPKLVGVNVTIPFKEEVIPYLSHLDASAKKVEAVNVIKKQENSLIGFNSDYYGFRESLLSWFKYEQGAKALILGTGGASKAVSAVLHDEGIDFSKVSRGKSKEAITYEELEKEGLSDYQLIINTTPLGMFPNVEDKPKLPYSTIAENSYFYDLIYNPSETAFLSEAKRFGVKTKNGYDMLILQAEKSWEIWNS